MPKPPHSARTDFVFPRRPCPDPKCRCARCCVPVLMLGTVIELLPWFMGTDRRPRAAARSVISFGHLLVGGAALVFAGVMTVAGRAPNAELDGALLGVGLVLALAATVFTCTAFLVLRRAHDGRGALLSLILSIVELVVGAAMAAALAIAVQGYGAFEPWRSPLLLPSALLVALGLAGLGLEVGGRRPEVH